MKRRHQPILGLLSLAFFLSLFPSCNFDRRLALTYSDNPLWNDQKGAKDTDLTRALVAKGFTFRTGRGEEAYPDGVCFGAFGRDEYWVIQYHPDTREVTAYSWIIHVNWIGYLRAQIRFAQLENILQNNLRTSNQAE